MKWPTRVCVAVLTTVLGLAGCGSLHSDRRATPADLCAGALPAGQAVAGSDADLVRLRRLSTRAVADLLVDLQAPALRPPGASATASPAASADPAREPGLCALAYRGSFDAARLPAVVTRTGSTGSVLVLVVTTRHPRVLRAIVLQQLPSAL